MSDTEKSKKYNACLNIQVGQNKELIVGGKTIQAIGDDQSIVFNASKHILDLKTGERKNILGDNQKLANVKPENLKEIRKALQKKLEKGKNSANVR